MAARNGLAGAGSEQGVRGIVHLQFAVLARTGGWDQTHLRDAIHACARKPKDGVPL